MNNKKPILSCEEYSNEVNNNKNNYRGITRRLLEKYKPKKDAFIINEKKYSQIKN